MVKEKCESGKMGFQLPDFLTETKSFKQDRFNTRQKKQCDITFPAARGLHFRSSGCHGTQYNHYATGRKTLLKK